MDCRELKDKAVPKDSLKLTLSASYKHILTLTPTYLELLIAGICTLVKIMLNGAVVY
jgi:hypothetical protein